MSELAKALVAARSEMTGTVFKSGVNQHQRYAYVGHEAVIRSGAREALAKHGLALVQTEVELLLTDVPAGKVSAHLWRGKFALLHASGERLDLTMMATTQPNDKSAFVASTALERVALQRVLLLAGSSEEDPEADVHDQRTHQVAHAHAQPGQGSAQSQATPPSDPMIGALIDRLYKATPDVVTELLSSARSIFRSCRADEREALTQAVDFAKARTAQLIEDARAETELAKERQRQDQHAEQGDATGGAT